MRVHRALLLAALGIGCGGSGDGGAGPAVVASVTISPGADITTFTPGSTVGLTATVKDASGATMTAKTPTWTTTDGTKLAASAASGTSTTVTALTTGSAKIIAAIDGKSDTVNITVVAQVFTGVSLTPLSQTLQPAGTLLLAAKAVDQNGIAMAGTGFGTPSFSSNNTAVATVNATSGLVTAVANGSATITASIVASGVTKTGTTAITVATGGGFPASASVAAVGSSAWSPIKVDIAVGGTVTFSNTTTFVHNVMYSGGTGVPANIADWLGDVRTSTFNVAGTFNYICGIHPGMTGSVVVH